jgi:hypothetical protein
VRYVPLKIYFLKYPEKYFPREKESISEALLTDLKNIAVCVEWDKQNFNFQKHIFGK